MGVEVGVAVEVAVEVLRAVKLGLGEGVGDFVAVWRPIFIRGTSGVSVVTDPRFPTPPAAMFEGVPRAETMI